MRRIALILPILALAACGQPTPRAASVEHAIVQLPAVPGRPGAAYFALHGGPVDDRLMAVSSPLAVKAEMHEMKVAGGMMSMAAIEGGLAVPAGGKVEFSTGGNHVMLFDISPKVAVGGKMPLQLSFASGDKLDAEAEVVAAGTAGDHAH